MPSTNITVIGAGALGTSLSSILASRGVKVRLVTNDPTILTGATTAAKYFHPTATEYPKKGHFATGKSVVEGAITQLGLYGRGFLHNPNKKGRFWVSKDSSKLDLPIKVFQENIRFMSEYYSTLHNEFLESSWQRSDVENIFYDLDDFSRSINSNDFGVKNVVSGVETPSSTLDMAKFYAQQKAILDQLGITPNYNTNTVAIKKSGRGYEVELNTGEKVHSNAVILAAGHHNLKLVELINGASPIPPGKWFLNGILQVKLPPTNNHELIRLYQGTNFTLQQENGCMFACTKPPTETTEGEAFIYYPSELGSQIMTHNNLSGFPKEFDNVIKNGLHEMVEFSCVNRIIDQANKFYPFISEAKPIKMIYRTVFSPATETNSFGLDRRERVFSRWAVTGDGLVIASTAPKFTNSGLKALHDAQYILGKLDLPSLPTKDNDPYNLDIPLITSSLHFRDIEGNPKDKVEYLQNNGLISV